MNRTKVIIRIFAEIFALVLAACFVWQAIEVGIGNETYIRTSPTTGDFNYESYP